MRMILQREESTAAGTFGTLTAGPLTLATVELPWRENAEEISCIPPGIYPTKRRRFHRGGYPAIGIDDVPGRSLILIHRANWAHELRGCIGVGLSRGRLRGKPAVLSSAVALAQLLEVFAPGEIEIRAPA